MNNNGWISVDDKLPKHKGWMQVVNNGIVHPAFWHFTERYWVDTRGGPALELTEVTHWQLFPEPPEDEPRTTNESDKVDAFPTKFLSFISKGEDGSDPALVTAILATTIMGIDEHIHGGAMICYSHDGMNSLSFVPTIESFDVILKRLDRMLTEPTPCGSS